MRMKSNGLINELGNSIMKLEGKELDEFNKSKKDTIPNLKIALSFFAGMAFMFILLLIIK